MPTSNPHQPPTAGVVYVDPVDADPVDADPRPPRTAAADKLWAALRAHPGSTSVELATTAGIGRSTAAKLLTRWALDNIATRRTATASTGQPGKSPERWYITKSATGATDPDAPAPEEPLPHSGPGDIAAPVTDHAAEAAEPTELTAQNPPVAETATSDDHITAASTGSGAPEDRPTDGVDPATESDPDDADRTDNRAAGRSRVPAGASRVRRLPAGGLRGLVEDYLREHPEAAFGPSQIGKDLSRSGGAVANALVKLVDAGCAVVVQDKPRRYRLAPGEAAAATNTDA